MVSQEPRSPVLADVEGAHGTATLERHGWELELAASAGRLDVAVATALLRRLLEGIAARGGGTARWRVPVSTPEHVRAGTAAGFDPSRILFQMRRPLPAPVPRPPLETRPFVPDLDDAEWLRVNNAAFDWHPEQGGWGPAELRSRLDEDWYSADGFLLLPAESGGGPGSPIDGFCWTKLHAGTAPRQGEIYAIAVDPAQAGRGLGRRLVLAGLDHLHRVDGAEVAMLYTEADNAPAVALYRRLDFDVHHEVRVFTRRVTATDDQTPTPTSDPIA